MRSFGVIDEHVQHVAVSPVGNGLATLSLDSTVDGADPLERASRCLFVRENDLLSVARRGDQAANGVPWQFSRKEQPVDGTIERELGGASGEHEQHRVHIAPDPPHNRIATYEVVHRGFAIAGFPGLSLLASLPAEVS